MSDVVLCSWSLPDDAQHKGTVSDCLRLPEHDGLHVVGLAANGWCLLYEVHLDTQKLERVVHAQLEKGAPPTREQMAALLALLDAGRKRLDDPETPAR